MRKIILLRDHTKKGDALTFECDYIRHGANYFVLRHDDAHTIANTIEFMHGGDVLSVFNTNVRVKTSSVFTHTITVRKDTANSTIYENILIIGNKSINKLSNSEIDSLIATEQAIAMEEYNS